jgi:hypothetical protein
MNRFAMAFTLWKKATMYQVELKERRASAYLAGVSESGATRV